MHKNSKLLLWEEFFLQIFYPATIVYVCIKPVMLAWEPFRLKGTRCESDVQTHDDHPCYKKKLKSYILERKSLMKKHKNKMKCKKNAELLPIDDGSWNDSLDLSHFLPKKSKKIG